MPCSARNLALPRDDARARRPCRRRPCRPASRSRSPATARACAPARRSTMASASGCSLARSTLASFCSTSSAVKPGAGSMCTTFGRPSVSVPVLSTTSVSTFSMRSSASASRMSTPCCAPLADADHDGHRRGQAQRTGTGDDEHGHRGDERVAERRARPPDQPGDEGQHRHEDDDRHEPAGHLVGHALDGRAAALRRGHHVDDLREQRVGADLLGAHHEAAGLVHRAGRDLGARPPWPPASARRSPSTRRRCPCPR